MPGQEPSFVSTSLWQIPQARTWMRTYPASGVGILRSTIWKSAPAFGNLASFMSSLSGPAVWQPPDPSRDEIQPALGVPQGPGHPLALVDASRPTRPPGRSSPRVFVCPRRLVPVRDPLAALALDLSIASAARKPATSRARSVRAWSPRQRETGAADRRGRPLPGVYWERAAFAASRACRCRKRFVAFFPSSYGSSGEVQPLSAG